MGARSVPALYGALTAGLVAVVMVVASVVSPATPPSIAELSPSARDRIEEARAEQGIGSGKGGSGNCAPGDLVCARSQGKSSVRDDGGGVAPPVEVAAGRQCFGNPPRQTEDPHSPPCVFKIFKGDNGGATAPGVTATEIRVAITTTSQGAIEEAIAEALIAHFNRRYEFYGRRLAPVFVPAYPQGDPAANRAAAEDLIAAESFAVVSPLHWVTNAVIHRRLAEERVMSIVNAAPAFASDHVADGFTWLVEPPLDARLQAGGSFVCRAFVDRPAHHAGPEFQGAERRFAIVVRTENSGTRPDPGPLVDRLGSCGAEFDVFDLAWNASEDQRRNLMLNLKTNGFSTVLQVAAGTDLQLYKSATNVGYFPEWIDLGLHGTHIEAQWASAGGRSYTGGQGDHAFGITPQARVGPESEDPAMWALREGDPTLDPSPFEEYVRRDYRGLLVLASGIQGAGPNLTAEKFARALRTMNFPNPNPGGAPYWQQRISFGIGDPIFYDDYAIWWWNEDAPSQTDGSATGRGSFCYLDRGARFTADSFPADADSRLFSPSEPCR